MKRKFSFNVCIALIICAIIVSCGDDDSSGSTDFLIKVDSIHCPDTVTENTRFDIEFFGIIGFNGCYSFKTFNQRINDEDITIEAWGTYDNNAGPCTAALVKLDGKKLSMNSAIPGLYRIEISEPDLTVIVKLVLVKKKT